MVKMDSDVNNKISFKNKLESSTPVDKLCRSCLCEVNKDYFSLDGYYLEKKIIDIYRNVISDKIAVSDFFPKRLCTICYNQIVKFDLFKNKVLQSETRLAEHVDLVTVASNQENKESFCKSEFTEKDNVSENDFVCVSIEAPDNQSLDSEDEVPILERAHKIDELVKQETDIEHDEPDYVKLCLVEDNIDCELEDGLEVNSFDVKVKKDIKMTRKKENRDKDKERHGRKKESCKQCGKVVFAYKLQNHMRTHTKEKPYGCAKCDKKFSEKSNLNRHIKTHGVDRPFKCDICGKGFLRPSSRAIHIQTAHNSERSVTCPICTKGFKHHYFLKKHINIVHNTSNVKIRVQGQGYPCPICKQIYRSKSSLNVHKVKHDQPKPYLCNICGNSYSTKAVLENHQSVHTGEKKFNCTICDKKFRFVSTLKTHELVHSGEKPLSCPICNQKFRQHSHLNTHIRGQHSTSRPYQCSFCSKTFKQSCNLTVHTRIHTGETPYVCEICEKGFYDSSSLKKHKKSHFDKNIYPSNWDNLGCKIENDPLHI